MSLPESIFASGKPETLLGVCLFNLLFAVQTPSAAECAECGWVTEE